MTSFKPAIETLETRDTPSGGLNLGLLFLAVDLAAKPTPAPAKTAVAPVFKPLQVSYTQPAQGSTAWGNELANMALNNPIAAQSYILSQEPSFQPQSIAFADLGLWL